jgi:hypothetical protein
MANNTSTPDQNAAEKIGRAIDGQILALQSERDTLTLATARIAEIDAELTVLAAEQSKIAGRRPPKSAGPPGATPLGSANVNTKR